MESADVQVKTIRSAASCDAESIARLHIASWQAAYRTELPASFLSSQDLEKRTSAWQTQLTNPTTRVLVAEQEQRLLGFCASGPARDADTDPAAWWEIYNLHVSPERRGGGIGSELFDQGVMLALQSSAQELVLWVVISNHPARRFYEKKGMAADGAEQLHQLADDVALREVRYRMALPPR
jgi:ribosomal protein S18 acetylase RimI-like enzyme